MSGHEDPVELAKILSKFQTQSKRARQQQNANKRTFKRKLAEVHKKTLNSIEQSKKEKLQSSKHKFDTLRDKILKAQRNIENADRAKGALLAKKMTLAAECQRELQSLLVEARKLSGNSIENYVPADTVLTQLLSQAFKKFDEDAAAASATASRATSSILGTLMDAAASATNVFSAES